MALWTPAQISTQLWLDASDSTTITIATGVSQWRDKSGNARHASQATTTVQPALISAGLNGLDCIRFVTDDFLGGGVSLFSGANPASVFVVYKPRATSGIFTIFGQSTGTGTGTWRELQFRTTFAAGDPYFAGYSADVTDSATPTTVTKLGCWAYDGTILTLYRHGISIASYARALNTTAASYLIGKSSAGEFANMDLAEIVVLSSTADTTTRQLLEGYLAWRWGTVADLAADHPYKSAAPTIPDTTAVVSLLSQPYYLEGTFRALLSQLYHLTAPLAATCTQLYGLQMLAILAQHYGDVPVVRAYIEQYYGSSAELKKTLLQKYGDSPLVLSYLKQPYKILDFLTSSLVQKYPILGESILVSLTQEYNIRDLNGLITALRQQYSVLSDRSGESSSFSVKISGAEIQCSGFKVQHSLLEYCLSCEVTVNNETVWENIKVYDPIEIQIKDDIYHLIVVEKSKNEVAGTWRYNMAGRSGSVILDFPHAAEIKNNDLVSGLCSEVVSSIAAIKGKNITWEIPADESITSNDVQISGNSPLSGIKAIVNEFGGIVQTYPSGAIKALPMRPVNTNLYNTVVPDIEINVLSATSGFNSTTEKRSGYNKYFISNKANSGGYRLSAKEINDQTYNITASIVPWTDKLVTLSTSELTNAIITPAGIMEEELTEEIEIKNGIGNLAEPCYGILSYDYGTRVNLGAVSFNEDGSVSVAGGNSIVTIKYVTKHWLWVAKDIDPETVQFILVS